MISSVEEYLITVDAIAKQMENGEPGRKVEVSLDILAELTANLDKMSKTSDAMNKWIENVEHLDLSEKDSESQGNELMILAGQFLATQAYLRLLSYIEAYEPGLAGYVPTLKPIMNRLNEAISNRAPEAVSLANEMLSLEQSGCGGDCCGCHDECHR